MDRFLEVKYSELSFARLNNLKALEAVILNSINKTIANTQTLQLKLF